MTKKAFLYYQVQAALGAVPAYLAGARGWNARALNVTPEFWFGERKNAGALAHIDSHSTTTMSVQL